MNYEQLKNSILQEAIEGRLVPQDPPDEPAAVLLQRIREEKAKLVKEKKIKKDKNESIIYRNADGHWMERFEDKKRPEECIDDEIPFEIPETWEWCRTSNIIELLSGRDLSPQQYNDNREGIPYITGASNFTNKELIVNRWTNNPVTISNKGDLLITCKGTIGTMAINNIGDVHIARQVMAIKSHIFLPFVGLYLQNQVPSLIKKSVSMIPGISREDILSSLFPLPPLSEQHRIVSRIEEIMPKVEEYGKAQEKLDALNAKLPKDLKNSILLEAIEGRLVEQDPSDEPAAVLLQRIREEKAKLVKEKKIKKDKNESTIYRNADGHWMERFEDKKRPEVCIDEEVPFEIPETWEWVRLGAFLNVISGTSYNKKDIAENGIRIIRGGNIQSNQLVIKDDDIYVNESLKDEQKNICPNDIIIVASTGSLNALAKPAFISEYIPNVQIGAFLRILRPIILEPWPYLKNIILSFVFHNRIINMAKGININNVKTEYITDMLVPFPPLSEQHRIVSQLERLLTKVARLTP